MPAFLPTSGLITCVAGKKSSTPMTESRVDASWVMKKAMKKAVKKGVKKAVKNVQWKSFGA